MKVTRIYHDERFAPLHNSFVCVDAASKPPKGAIFDFPERFFDILELVRKWELERGSGNEGVQIHTSVAGLEDKEITINGVTSEAYMQRLKESTMRAQDHWVFLDEVPTMHTPSSVQWVCQFHLCGVLVTVLGPHDCDKSCVGDGS
jgi:hypothetical protein